MTRLVRAAILVMMAAAVLLAPRPAAAQSSDGWKVDLYPLYFWATSLDGELSAGPVTAPIFLSFADAKESLSGAFSFHLDATRGRWGVMSDLNFISLTTDADFTVLGRPVQGELDLDNVMFEAGASYLINEPSRFGIIGGLRTYTLSPRITLSANAGSASPVDASQTSANAFVGIRANPRLAEKWRLLSRADIGAGSAELTWSALLGFDYQFKPWGSVAFGYKGLGIDITEDAKAVREYDVIHYGPFFTLGMHWGK